VAIGIGLGAWAVSAAAALPLALLIAFLGTAALEIALGAGLLRRARGAWSFALSLTGVMAVTLVLALPAIHRSGVSPVLGAVAAALCGAQLMLLVMARREF
jgi:hypothetical protein